MASRTVLRRSSLSYGSRFCRPTTSYIVNSNKYSYDSSVSGRNYAAAGLKDLKNRITTIQSIVKVTASMKMIANAKLAKQQERLKESRQWQQSSFAFLESLYPQLDKNDEFYQDQKVEQDSAIVDSELLVTFASDRGLCGGVNSNIGREIIRLLKIKAGPSLIVVGDKTMQQIQREWNKTFAMGVSGVSGNKPVTFHECLGIAEKIVALPGEKITFVFSHFANMVTYQITTYVLPNLAHVLEDERRAAPFQWSDENILKSAYAFHVAGVIFCSLTECQTCEIAARMTAMDNATTNGNDLIKNLSLQYNKQRQTAITTELVEIVSGASAQDEAKKQVDE
eukprot:TRINITY_DN4505_c0_g7_i1.p1 TRINITY_DN4505_c0_g7~~TRINITY_DN4505_c0_g7_i1.p1  ORF type:complete len:338 (+),score=85.60 TRINITY_DN4505_c0_g7_i1:86-1099(+)